MRLAALWHPKAHLWVQGRQQVWQQIAEFQRNTPSDRAVIWVHCASLGEFEQGRPLIELLKNRFPDRYIVLSFFSPSGYEIRKNYPAADLVCYMPMDTPANARRFVAALQPELAIFVKYEFWYHHLRALQQRRVPVLLISAIFRPEQLFFKWYGGWYRRMLPLFSHIFVQNETSAGLLATIGVKQLTRAGDTRIDRVLQLRNQAPSFPEVAAFVGSAPVFVAGSTWPADEQLLFPLFQDQLPPDWKIILAPHEISPEHIGQIEQKCGLLHVRYSQLRAQEIDSANIRLLIIDNIGMLSALYQYGRVAYIGGGFGKAIHNLLEPIAFGLPVLFGPRHEKFQEALELKKSGGGFAIQDEAGLRQAFSALRDEAVYRHASQQAYGYLLASQGSTKKILDFISQQFAVT